TDVTACSAPERLTITKTAATPTFDATTGHWTIVYTVKVSNASPVNQFYDLADAPAFPAGVTIVSGSATTDGPSTQAGSWTGTPRNTIRGTGVPIAAATGTTPTVHTYTLTVVASVAGVPPTTPVECADSTPGHGFFNRAPLSQGPIDTTADACKNTPV